MKSMDLVILGGGPAGLAAAIAARRAGVEDLVILERDKGAGRHPEPVHPQRLRAAYLSGRAHRPEYAARLCSRPRTWAFPAS